MNLNIHYCFLGPNRAPLLRFYFFVSFMSWICALDLFVVARDFWCVFGISDTRVALRHFMTCKQVSTYAGIPTVLSLFPIHTRGNQMWVTLKRARCDFCKVTFSEVYSRIVIMFAEILDLGSRHVSKDLLMYIGIASTLSMLFASSISWRLFSYVAEVCEWFFQGENGS